MLARTLERSGGHDEDRVRGLKEELREAVLKKNGNRLGDFEDNNFYHVATLCDPRCNSDLHLNDRSMTLLSQVQRLIFPSRGNCRGSKTTSPLSCGSGVRVPGCQQQ